MSGRTKQTTKAARSCTARSTLEPLQLFDSQSTLSAQWQSLPCAQKVCECVCRSRASELCRHDDASARALASHRYFSRRCLDVLLQCALSRMCAFANVAQRRQALRRMKARYRGQHVLFEEHFDVLAKLQFPVGNMQVRDNVHISRLLVWRAVRTLWRVYWCMCSTKRVAKLRWLLLTAQAGVCLLYTSPSPRDRG